MGFYIRDISKTDRFYFKSNADLIVTSEYEASKYGRLFKHIFEYDGLSLFKKEKTEKVKYRHHNKDLCIVSKIDVKALFPFILNKGYRSIELLIPASFNESDIDCIINEIEACFLDFEIDVGILIIGSSYLTKRKEFLKHRGVFISSFIPELIDIREEETRLTVGSAEPNEFDLLPLSAGTPKTSFSRKKVIKDDYVLEESFKEKLFRYLNKSGKTNVEIYTKGGMTRKLFSKILVEEDYCPKKETICCLIIGMELCLEDALDLLDAAGYTLTNSLPFDYIVKTHIKNKDFNLASINEELDSRGLVVLGWKPRED